ncbi:YtfJ family protein [Salmonella enterica]|uniref:YtfJ family protein n=1 Tax=Salmonella enterica TaxID=28901 RepID=UPI0009AFCDEB|nr:YtfJ family protein [Salmonella enterica]
MTLRKILAMSCLLLPIMACAHNLEDNQRVPPVGIADRGELTLNKDEFSYKNWNSAQLAGKVRVAVHKKRERDPKKMRHHVVSHLT